MTGLRRTNVIGVLRKLREISARRFCVSVPGLNFGDARLTGAGFAVGPPL
jgi:hypothetical protein